MNAERMNMANATAKIEGSKEARPPGGFPLASAPKKIFICSPYRPTANDPPCRKAQMEANIQRAKTACRILATMGVLPLAPHLYFTQFLKDEDAQERATGIRFGMEWLEAADEVWVFGETIHGCRTRNRVVHQERTLKKGRAPSGAFARSGGFLRRGNTHKSDKKRCV